MSATPSLAARLRRSSNFLKGQPSAHLRFVARPSSAASAPISKSSPSAATRLRKLADGEVDATLLAYAGLRRLGKPEIPTELLDPSDFPPAPAQGAICIESRIGDARVNDLLEAINDHDTFDAVSCERAFLGALDGSCRTPIAGLATVQGDAIRFAGMILTPDGSRWHDVEIEGSRTEAAVLGARAGGTVRSKAGSDFFDSWN